MSQRRSKELGTEEYYNCTVVIRECFQPPPPFAVANQSHHSGDSHWRQTKTTSNAQLDIGIQKVVVLVLVARRPTGSPDSVCLVIWFRFFEMQCQIVWSALIWSNSSWASSQPCKSQIRCRLFFLSVTVMMLVVLASSSMLVNVVRCTHQTNSRKIKSSQYHRRHEAL